MKADNAIVRLREGNNRFIKGTQNHVSRSQGNARKFKDGQTPIAAVVCCSDSRVIPEIIFDTGFGDLFVIRTAGNLVSEFDLAGLEYAVSYLDVHLIVVAGHSSCRAVSAAVDDIRTGSVHLAALKNAIAEGTRFESDIDAAVRANSKIVAETLKKRSEILGSEDILITHCFYDLEGGEVRWL